jgi:hypothetical protein
MTNNINYFYGLKARNQPIVTKYIAVISAIWSVSLTFPLRLKCQKKNKEKPLENQVAL